MSDPLATYLHDHLAGSVHAISLLEFIRDEHDGERLGRFASSLLREIQADRETLQDLADRVGVGSSEVKELTAWITEKFSRLKLRRGAQNGVGTFEALEFLELGIHGKWALWRALGTVAETDTRLRGLDYEHLAARAEAQRSIVEERRLETARQVLHPARSARN
ncbi:MAG: hypothetical protein JWO71_2296 [Candidatus Acidoferrum typicum]|nr:hypothetical protein [Candidatus Acidoferrum typicum]